MPEIDYWSVTSKPTKPRVEIKKRPGDSKVFPSLLGTPSSIPDFFGGSKRGQLAKASKMPRKQGERQFKRAENLLNFKDDYSAGMSTRALGRKYGLSQSATVRFIHRMKANNWKPKPKARRKSRAKAQPSVVSKRYTIEQIRG